MVALKEAKAPGQGNLAPGKLVENRLLEGVKPTDQDGFCFDKTTAPSMLLGLKEKLRKP